MPLARRIIPTILCRGRQAVKGRGFDAWRPIGLVMEKVRVHQARGVDELVLLDITATKEGRGPDLALVEELSACLFAPLAVGGGIRSLQDVKELLRAGADKVVLGTAALEQPELINEIAQVVGSQAVVVSVDYRENMVLSHSGSRTAPYNPEDWARMAVSLGAGEILLQNVDRDGTLAGYCLWRIGNVSRMVGVPVIASGGAGTYEHMHEALQAGASAVAAGAMFQFTDATPRGAARYLADRGHEVRT